MIKHWISTGPALAVCLLIASSCLYVTPAGDPNKIANRYTLFTPVQQQLERARAEASRRIEMVPECRAEFERLPNWRHGPVHVFLIQIPVGKTSPWIAKTLCFKDGSSHILIKEDFLNWTVLKNRLEAAVQVVLHELVHVNQCPDGFKKDNTEPEAQRIEDVCSLPKLDTTQENQGD